MKELINKCFDFYKKHKEILNYLICGGLATVINIGVFALFNYVILGKDYYVVSNAIAIVAAVVFQYFTNKFFVFERKEQTKKENVIEAVKFFAGRVVTGLIDEGLMKLGVDLLHINEMIMKIIVQIIIIILNYIISKFLVFTKGKDDKKASV